MSTNSSKQLEAIAESLHRKGMCCPVNKFLTFNWNRFTFSLPEAKIFSKNLKKTKITVVILFQDVDGNSIVILQESISIMRSGILPLLKHACGE